MRWAVRLVVPIGVALYLAAPAAAGELRPFAPPPQTQQMAPPPQPDPFQRFREQAARLTPEERQDLKARLEDRLKRAKEQGDDTAAYRYYRFLRILEEQP
ncbi:MULTISPECIES: hypothetical protein [Deferrisoma]